MVRPPLHPRAPRPRFAIPPSPYPCHPRLTGLDGLEPCTRGIWACLVDPDAVRREFPGVDLPGIQTSVCLLLDTEGLGSYAADRTHDASVFALAIRLSSLLVYNSVGSIDEGALEKLGYAC